MNTDIKERISAAASSVSLYEAYRRSCGVVEIARREHIDLSSMKKASGCIYSWLYNNLDKVSVECLPLIEYLITGVWKEDIDVDKRAIYYYKQHLEQLV